MLLVDNAQLILQLDNAAEKDKLVAFFHHLISSNIADVVMVFSAQGFADEYICKAGDIELTHKKFNVPSKEKVVTILSNEIADYMGETDTKHKGAYHNKFASIFVELIGGQIKVIRRIFRAFKIGRATTVEGFAELMHEKVEEKHKHSKEKIHELREKVIFKFDVCIFLLKGNFLYRS